MQKTELRHQFQNAPQSPSELLLLQIPSVGSFTRCRLESHTPFPARIILYLVRPAWLKMLVLGSLSLVLIPLVLAHGQAPKHHHQSKRMLNIYSAEGVVNHE